MTTPVIMYTELYHTVVLDVPGDAEPMKADNLHRFQPTRVVIKYAMRTQDKPGTWESGVQVTGLVTGPWLPRTQGGRPISRTGTASLFPYDRPAWLQAMIDEHHPKWIPELPAAVIIPDTSKRATP